MIVVLEGADGSGKSTTADALSTLLCSMGYNAQVYREPGGTKLGEKLRPMVLDKDLAMNPLSQTMLFLASRFQLLYESLPKLNQGAIMIFDRFSHSTYAYQCGGNDAPRHLVAALAEQVNAIINSGVENEDYRQVFAFNLTVPPEVAKQRLLGTGKKPDRFEGAGAAFAERVRQAYEDLEDEIYAARQQVTPLVAVDANRPTGAILATILFEVRTALNAHPRQAQA